MKILLKQRIISTTGKILIYFYCLLVLHVANAKSETLSPEDFNKSPSLDLNLPDDSLKINSSAFLNPDGKKNLEGNEQILAGGKKQKRLNLDCGMDVYSNAAPDVPLSNRLSGECDFKYKY